MVISEGNLTFKAKINAKELQKGDIYRYEVIIKPKSYLLPDWISQWDMDVTKLQEWNQGKEKFNGSTTLNLMRFLTDFSRTNMQVHKPKIAHFYCYVKRR